MGKRTVRVRTSVKYAARSESEIQADRERLRPHGVKTCPTCHKSLPLSSFGKCKTEADGLNSLCKLDAIKHVRRAIEKRKQRSKRAVQAVIRKLHGPTGTKYCKPCKTKHPLSHFAMCANSVDLRAAICKQASNEIKRRRKREVAAYRLEIRKGKPCGECGKIPNPYCLEFAHLRREDKKRTRGGRRSESSSLSLKSFKQELEKLRLLCRNCHA